MPKTYQGADQKKIHFLFMISAKEATVTHDSVFTLKDIDHKVLFMTARPGRCRAFIPIEVYMDNWIKNNQLFIQEPPRVAIIYSGMKENSYGKAKAIPIEISNPIANGPSSWKFTVKNLTDCQYQNITLFIDWPAPLDCPEPIKIQVPSLIGDWNA